MPDDPARLKLLGYWDAPSHYDTTSCVGWIFPQRLQDPSWRPQQRAPLAAYLRSGAAWSGAMGSSACRFAGCAGGGGSRDLTDGEWLWPEGLAHYVEAHDVRLPDAFADAAAARGFAVPDAAARVHRRGFDGAAWLKWGAQQVPPPAPLPGAIPLDAAQKLAARLSLPGCRFSIAPFHAQWLVTAALDGGSACDLLPPCPADALALHLHRWRRVPPEQALSPAELQRLLDEAFPQAGLWARLQGFLTSTSPRPTLKQTPPSGLCLWSGSQGIPVPPTDDLGWRHRLSLLAPGEPERPLTQHLFAAFGSTAPA